MTRCKREYLVRVKQGPKGYTETHVNEQCQCFDVVTDIAITSSTPGSVSTIDINLRFIGYKLSGKAY